MQQNTILVVDDSPTDMHVTCNALESHGFRTIGVSSAEDVMFVIEEQQPAAIIMDVVMPGTNGFQATRKINRNPGTADIPVIILSSKSKESDKVWGMRQGAAGYIVKPFVPDELVRKVREVLGSRT